MTKNTQELAARLREWPGRLQNGPLEVDLFQAADALEALQAEIVARDKHDDSFVARINELLAERNASTAISLNLEIRRNADGVIATDMWTDWEFNTYWWNEGNAHCDCNRELFFLRARNEDDEAEIDCSHGRYSVRLTNADTGEVLYDELGADRVQG